MLKLFILLYILLNVSFACDKYQILRDYLVEKNYTTVQIEKIFENKFLVDTIVVLKDEDCIIDENMVPKKNGESFLRSENRKVMQR